MKREYTFQCALHDQLYQATYDHSKMNATYEIGDPQGQVQRERREDTDHIDVQLHFIKDELQKGVVELKYCPTRDMLADGLTKPLPRPTFEDHRERMNICNVR